MSGFGVGDLDDMALNELGDTELEGLLEQMWMQVMGQVSEFSKEGGGWKIVFRSQSRVLAAVGRAVAGWGGPRWGGVGRHVCMVLFFVLSGFFFFSFWCVVCYWLCFFSVCWNEGPGRLAVQAACMA